jgi:hypothetical protein
MGLSTIVVPMALPDPVLTKTPSLSSTLTVPADPNKDLKKIIERKDSFLPPLEDLLIAIETPPDLVQAQSVDVFRKRSCQPVIVITDPARARAFSSEEQ